MTAAVVLLVVCLLMLGVNLGLVLDAILAQRSFRAAGLGVLSAAVGVTASAIALGA